MRLLHVLLLGLLWLGFVDAGGKKKIVIVHNGISITAVGAATMKIIMGAFGFTYLYVDSNVGEVYYNPSGSSSGRKGVLGQETDPGYTLPYDFGVTNSIPLSSEFTDAGANERDYMSVLTSSSPIVVIYNVPEAKNTTV
jgi:hypothetical protein